LTNITTRPFLKRAMPLASQKDIYNSMMIVYVCDHQLWPHL